MKVNNKVFLFLRDSVVLAVEPQQECIAYISQFGQPFHAGSYLIEHVAMCYEIMLSVAFQYVIFCNGQVGELKGSKIVKKIVMIATYINDFRTVFSIIFMMI